MNDNDIFNFFKGFKAIPDKENEKDIIEEYVKGLITKEQFLETTEPFEWLYQYRENPFQMKQLCNRIYSHIRHMHTQI